MERFRPALPVAVGALCVLGAAGLLLSTRYQLERARQALRLEHSLQALALRVNEQMQQGNELLSGMPTASGASFWHPWNWRGVAPAPAAVAPLDAADLQRLLAAVAGATSPASVDLLPTDEARDALVLVAADHAQGGRTGRGVWCFVDELMLRADVVGFARAGYRVRLYDVAQSAPWYDSATGPWAATATLPLQLAGQQLELRGALRSGPIPVVPMAAPSLLLALGVLLWFTLELSGRRALGDARGDLAESEHRRRLASKLYGESLQTITDLESRLRQVSLFDGATGLANRSSLIHRLETLLAAARSGQVQGLCVLAVAFDSLRHIISSLGADFAERVLAVGAERIAATLPSRDNLFRSADQQLAVLLVQEIAADAPGMAVQEPEQLAERIARLLAAPLSVDGHMIILHPSIGIASTDSAYERAETLLDQASMAVVAVPHDSEARHCRYSSEAARASAERLQLEAELDRAFEEGQFELEFEPFVQPISQAVVGFEALIRWNHPTEGRLLPGRFVPLALQAGMAHRLNTWVMGEAARQAAALRRAGYSDLFVNFNLTAEEFLRPDLVEELAGLLSSLELPGEQLVVELTESTLVQDARAAAHTMHALAELGVGAWLDDFGTGYSSLSHLRGLPLKGVKIDRAFTEHIGIDSRDFGFVKALIDLISYLGMQSIAEGVETASQYELLNMTSCDLYQGYYFARSMPAYRVDGWLKQRAEQGFGGEPRQDRAATAPLMRSSA